MKAVYSITGQDGDITYAIAERFIGLTLVDQLGYSNDRFSVSLDDRNQTFSFPKRGENLAVKIGYDDTTSMVVPHGLIDMGSYVLDELEWSSDPDTLIFTCHAADSNGRFKTLRNKSFHDTTIKAIVEDCADFCDFTPSIESHFESVKVKHEDQINQSCMDFLRELGNRYGGVAKIQSKGGKAKKNGKDEEKTQLLFYRPDNGKVVNPSIIPVREVKLSRTNLRSIVYTLPSKGVYGNVVAYYHDRDGSKSYGMVEFKRSQVNVADDEIDKVKPVSEKTLPGIYANREEAFEAAQSHMRALALGEAALTFVSIGDARIKSESDVLIDNLRKGIPSKWRVVRVTHRIDSAGAFVTSCECELPENKKES